MSLEAIDKILEKYIVEVNSIEGMFHLKFKSRKQANEFIVEFEDVQTNYDNLYIRFSTDHRNRLNSNVVRVFEIGYHDIKNAIGKYVGTNVCFESYFDSWDDLFDYFSELRFKYPDVNKIYLDEEVLFARSEPTWEDVADDLEEKMKIHISKFAKEEQLRRLARELNYDV